MHVSNLRNRQAAHALYSSPRLMGAVHQFTVLFAIWRLRLYTWVLENSGQITRFKWIDTRDFDRNNQVYTNRTSDITLSNMAMLLQQEMTSHSCQNIVCKRTSPCGVTQKEAFSGFNCCWLCTFCFPLRVWMNLKLQNKIPLKIMSLHDKKRLAELI